MHPIPGYQGEEIIKPSCRGDDAWCSPVYLGDSHISSQLCQLQASVYTDVGGGGKGVMDGTKYQGSAMGPASCLDQRSQEGIHLMEHFSYCMEQPSPVPRALPVCLARLM